MPYFSSLPSAAKLLPLALLPALLLTAGAAQSQAIRTYTMVGSGSNAAAYQGLQPTTAAAVRTAGDGDEGYYNNLPIGFPFTFGGTAYTTVSASTNGWLTFGQPITNATPANNLTSGTPRPIVAPLWDDISFGAPGGAAGTDGDLFVQTSGTAGSRIFTIEWRNIRWNTAAAGPVASCLVQLLEATSEVKLMYLQGSTSASGSNRTASVGIAGTASGDFISLASLSLTTTTSTTTETTTISGRATSGRIFTFTPATTTASQAAVAQHPLQLAPNPASTEVRVLGHDARQPLRLLDAQGRVVRTLRAGSTSLDLHGLAAGLYLVQAGLRTQRLVVE